jgi:phage-related protein
MKAVVWMGSSREDLKRFPDAAQHSLGFELYRVQCGLDPKDWKPMTSVGSGVREIRARDEAGIFRVIYLATSPKESLSCTAFRRRHRRRAARTWKWQ